MAANRQRFTGGADAIFMALDRLVRPMGRIGRSFLKYDEAEKVGDARTDAKQIAAASAVLASLHGLSAKLSFKRSEVATAIERLFDCHCEQWGTRFEHKADFSAIMTRRVMNICRVVSQGDGKTKRPDWCCTLPWRQNDVAESAAVGADDGGDIVDGESAEEVDEEEASEEPPSPPLVAVMRKPAAQAAAQPQYFFGWAQDLKNAFRQLPNQRKELAIEIAPNAGSLTEPIVAVFKDGSRSTIADITYEEYLDAMACPRKRVAEDHWSGEHITTKHALKIRTRADRGLLISLYEQGRQVCQVDVKKWDPAEGEVGTARAIEFMLPIATKYMNDLVERSALYALRDELLKAEFPTRAAGKAAPKKRPAGAMETSNAQTENINNGPATSSSSSRTPAPDADGIRLARLEAFRCSARYVGNICFDDEARMSDRQWKR